MKIVNEKVADHYKRLATAYKDKSNDYIRASVTQQLGAMMYNRRGKIRAVNIASNVHEFIALNTVLVDLEEDGVLNWE